MRGGRARASGYGRRQQIWMSWVCICADGDACCRFMLTILKEALLSSPYRHRFRDGADYSAQSALARPGRSSNTQPGLINRKTMCLAIAQIRFWIFAMLSTHMLLCYAPGVSAHESLSERHNPSGISLRLWLDDGNNPLAFSDYVITTRSALSKYRWAVPGETAAEHEDRVELVAPREWPRRAECDANNTEGVLLIHGLTDSPFLMRDLGDFFQRLPSRCLLIRSILLPGHGSTPGDLDIVTYEHWIEAARYGIDSFERVATGVHIVGFSTGGALGVYWVLNPLGISLAVPIKSLILFSPAILPKNWVTHIEGLPELGKLLVDTIHRGKWIDIFADQDFAKYESFPLNAAYQIYRLDKVLKRQTKIPIPVPVFMALSRNDQTVDAEVSIKLFFQQTNEASRMVIMTNDNGTALVKEATARHKHVELFPATIKAQRVLDFAHTSFVVEPSNPHYGQYGKYAACLSYGNDKDPQQKYCPCITQNMYAPRCRVKGSDLFSYGEITKEALKANVLRRLTFNPYFEPMTKRIEEFIEAVGRH